MILDHLRIRDQVQTCYKLWRETDFRRERYEKTGIRTKYDNA